jgi:hypothetical protein
MYRSKYGWEFKGKPTTGDIKVAHDVYTPNKATMDLTTHNQENYKSYTIEKKPVVEDVPYASDIRFAAKSSYASEFPSWGNVG